MDSAEMFRVVETIEPLDGTDMFDVSVNDNRSRRVEGGFSFTHGYLV